MTVRELRVTMNLDAAIPVGTLAQDGQARSSPVCGHVSNVPRDALIQLGKRLGLRRQETSQILDEVLTVAERCRDALADAGCRTSVSLQAARAVEVNLRVLGGA